MKNPNGYGSIIKLSGKRRNPFAIVVTDGFDDNGKQIRRYISYHPTKKDAMIALADYNANPYDLEKSNITLRQLFDLWYNQKFKKEINVEITKNMISYKSAFSHCKKFQEKPFLDLRATHLQEIIDNCPAGYPTKKKIKTLFNQLYDFARFKNLNIRDKFNELVKVTNDHKARKKIPFSENEIEILWDNVNDKLNLDIALILIYTGFRISELLNIETENVNLKEMYIKGGMKTEAGIDRIVPIHHRILPFIEKRYNENNKYLIVNKFDRKFQYSNFKREFWERWMKEFKMEHSPHETRHTTATLLKKYNADELFRRRILGHAVTDTTDKFYTHETLEQLQKTIELLP